MVLEWAQEGKVCRLKMGKAQLLMASVMTSTPMMLSRNPARAWWEESQFNYADTEQHIKCLSSVPGCSRALPLAKLWEILLVA